MSSNAMQLVVAGENNILATRAVPESAVSSFHPHLDARRRVTQEIPGVQLVHKRKMLNDEGRKLTESEIVMRRARQREFRDEFMPASHFEGIKEGYYFSTGSKGLGYYLDYQFWDLNDADDQGYILVRTPPAVALHRALKLRLQRGSQTLLLSPKLLEALGPSHGDSEGHRYKLVTPPWMGGMRPPVETFERKDESGLPQVWGRNELLCERYEYLKSLLYALPSSKEHNYEDDQAYLRQKHQNAITRRMAAAEIASRIDKDEETTTNNTQCDDIILIEALAGPLRLSGSELLPQAPNKGPWVFILQLQGVEAETTPLKFKATLKKNSLRWPVTRLLELFASRYTSKYTDTSLDVNRLRLHLSDSSYATNDTLLAEIIQRWDGDPPHATFGVRLRRGAGTEAQARPSARAKAIAERDQLQINEWSTQTQVLKAREREKNKKPMTSEEIRTYWEERKHEKHWRTDAALRGYYTRTDDSRKLRAWSKIRLLPERGFFLNKATDSPFIDNNDDQ